MKKAKIEKTPREIMREEIKSIHPGSIIVKPNGYSGLMFYQVTHIINEKPSPACAEQDRTLIVRSIGGEKVRKNAVRHHYADVILFADIKIDSSEVIVDGC